MRTPTINGRRREIGLGSAAKVSARPGAQAARRAARAIAQSHDPVAGVGRQGSRRQAEDFRGSGRCGDREDRAGWKTSLEGRCSTLDQWRRDANVTCKPIARKFLDEITIADVKGVIQPYWDREQLDSARSLQKRIEAIFDYATAHGWRSGDNPASWNISSICGRARRPRTSITPPCPRATRRRSASACASLTRPAPGCLSSSC